VSVCPAGLLQHGRAQTISIDSSRPSPDARPVSTMRPEVRSSTRTCLIRTRQHNKTVQYDIKTPANTKNIKMHDILCRYSSILVRPTRRRLSHVHIRRAIRVHLVTTITSPFFACRPKDVVWFKFISVCCHRPSFSPFCVSVLCNNYFNSAESKTSELT